MSRDQRVHREQQEADGHVWGTGTYPKWEQHAAVPKAGVKHTQLCCQPKDKTVPPQGSPPATLPLGSYPKSCWSSPNATGSRGLPPSCSTRLCSFFATKLNLSRE